MDDRKKEKQGIDILFRHMKRPTRSKKGSIRHRERDEKSLVTNENENIKRHTKRERKKE